MAARGAHGSGPSRDVHHLVASMQRMLGPWLQAHIESNVAEAVERAARAHIVQSSAPAPAPAINIEAVGRRIDEAMRVAIAKAAVAHPQPAPAAPGAHAFDGLIAAYDQQARHDPNAKSCMKDACSPKPAHITVDTGPTIMQLAHQGENARYSPPSSPTGRGIGAMSPSRGAGSPDHRTPRSDRPASLPRLLSKRADSRRTLGETSVWTGTTCGAQTAEEGNKKAFYVNFRRLIEIKEKLDIIHEVIKATTIALLTLLAVSNGLRLAYDLGFLVCGIALYALHEMSHDALDIDDYKRVVGLLGNDGDDILQGSTHMDNLDNPNRCIQALSYSPRGRHKVFSYTVLSIFVVVASASWGLVWNVWMAECNWYCALGWVEPDEVWDIEHYVTLLLVGTLMLLCHFIYEGLYAREFKYIMPAKDLGNGASRPWDIALDGVPGGNMNWLFGLPCVWFSTREAYEDLRIWVTLASGLPNGNGDEAPSQAKARHQHTVWQVFFEEMAVYALEDCDCAARLRKSLLLAKLYDKQSKRFLRRLVPGEDEPRGVATVTMTNLHSTCTDGRDTFLPVDVVADKHQPEELAIELLFYDNRSGEVWIPNIPQEAETDAPMRLRHEASLTKERSFFTEMTK